MAETLTIRTASSTEVVKIAVPGPQGPAGQGVPTGGTTGQVLRKASGTDYDTEWSAAGSGSGSVTSVALASTDLTISGSPITSSGTITANIAANAVTLEKLQTISSEHLLGRHGNGNGGVQQIGLGTGLAMSGSNVGVTFGSSAGTACQGNDARLSDSRTPSAHASSHAAAGSDPLFDQDLNTTDAVEFASVGVDGTPVGSARKFHQHGGKFTIESDDGDYGQFQVVNPTAGEVTFVMVSAGTTQTNGQVSASSAANIWAFGLGPYGNDATDFCIGNNSGGSVFHLKPDGKLGIGPNSSAPTQALEVSGNVAIKDTDSENVATFVAELNLTANRTYDLPDRSGELMIVGDAPASHAHGNITNDGKIGSDSGRVLVTTTAGAVTTLALGTAGQVLTVNSGANGVEFAAASGGVTSGSVDNAVLRADGVSGSQSQSSDLIVDDPVVAFACTGDAGTDIITAVGHNFTENQRIRFQSLTGGAGLFSGGPASSTNYFVRNISGNTFQVSTTSGGAAVNFTTNITAGAVLAVQRNLTLRTRKQAFAMTADAATDVITATGHTFVNGDAVSFYNLTGGNNLDEVSRWFVIEAATNTFKVSTSLNGAARDITTSYTGGTVELEIPLVLGSPRFSALILGDKPDGTIIGGNVRGYGAVDLQTNRNGQNAIASGNFSFIGNGQNNTASGLRAVVLGGTGNTANNTDAVVCGGEANGASGVRSIVCGGSSNNATAQWACIGGGTENSNGGTAAFVSGASNTATGGQSGILCGRNAGADRDNIFAHATGRFAWNGDAQTIRISLRTKTSTSSAAELQMGFHSGAYTGVWGTRYTIPSGKTVSALINIIAATSGGEFANRYVRAVTIANLNGTTALRGAVKDMDTEEQIGGADISITANDANDAIRIEFSGVAPVTGCTGTASTDRINKVAHGYSNNDDIVFTSLTGGAGLTANTVTYWVINANADDFQVSATRGGAAVNITTDYTDMTAARLFRVVAGIDAVEVGHGT